MKFLKGFARRFATTFSILSILFVGAVYAAVQFPTGTPGESIGSVVLMWLNGSGNAQGVSAANPLPVTVIGTINSQYPTGAVPLNPVSGIGTTTGVAVTLTPVSGKTAFICGYSIRANATAAANVTNTMVGLGNTVTHQMWVAPLASGIGIDEQIFTPCRPASAVTTNIVVTPGNPGAGGNVTADAWGYSL